MRHSDKPYTNLTIKCPRPAAFLQFLAGLLFFACLQNPSKETYRYRSPDWVATGLTCSYHNLPQRIPHSDCALEDHFYSTFFIKHSTSPAFHARTIRYCKNEAQSRMRDRAFLFEEYADTYFHHYYPPHWSWKPAVSSLPEPELVDCCIADYKTGICDATEIVINGVGCICTGVVKIAGGQVQFEAIAKRAYIGP